MIKIIKRIYFTMTCSHNHWIFHQIKSQWPFHAVYQAAKEILDIKIQSIIPALLKMAASLA